HEAHGVAADFLHDLAQCHELTGTLRHLYLLATAHELDELDDLDVELRLAGVAVERPDSRLHALDIAAVVGAPDVDHLVEAAIDLALVVGDVGGEIGVAAV